MFNSLRYSRRNTIPVGSPARIQKQAWSESHRRLQWKYTAFLIAAIFGTVSLFLGASYFQIRQNYDIFKALAYDTNPELVIHLERELTEYGLFMIAALASVFTFCLVLGLRITGNLIRPAIQLEKHIKKITYGDWGTDFRVRDGEDFTELLEAYSYLYRSLRAHTEAELKMLEKISVDTSNRESVALWKSLIQQKRAQLKLPASDRLTTDTSEEISKSRAFPRAS